MVLIKKSINETARRRVVVQYEIALGLWYVNNKSEDEVETLCCRGAMGKFKKFKLKWATKIILLCMRGHRIFYSFSI